MKVGLRASLGKSLQPQEYEQRGLWKKDFVWWNLKGHKIRPSSSQQVVLKRAASKSREKTCWERKMPFRSNQML